MSERPMEEAICINFAVTSFRPYKPYVQKLHFNEMEQHLTLVVEFERY